MHGFKGEHIRKVRTRFKSHWDITKGAGENLLLSPFRKRITIGDLKREGWSGKQPKAEKGYLAALTVATEHPCSARERENCRMWEMEDFKRPIDFPEHQLTNLIHLLA